MHRDIRMKAMAPGLVSLALTLLSGATSAWSVNYYLAVDQPAVLGGTRYMPRQIVRSESAAYSLETGLTPPTEFAALHRRPDGSWLFSPSHPVTLGGARYEARDVVAWDGAAAFALLLDGAAEGLPRNARIDALFIDRTSGRLILSFDVPVMIGGVRHGRSDLVARLAAGVFALFWDAEAQGVPARTNVVGADQESTGNLVIAFDIPTVIGASRFLPGELVKWDGFAFSSLFVDAAWPRSAQLRDFSFVPGAGRLDDGCVAAPAPPLDVTRNLVTGDLTLTWGASCLANDTDYEIYEGNLGGATTEFFYSHTAKICSTGGALNATFADPNPAAGYYYLVVPRNGVREGSYGERRPAGVCGAERPVGIVQCLAQEIAACP
jgi:hypothetical protein